MHTFERVTENSFKYMMLNLHPHSSDKFRVWASLSKNEGNTHAFVRKPKGQTEKHRPRLRILQCIDTQTIAPCYRDANESATLWCKDEPGPRVLTTNTLTKQRCAVVLPRTARR